MKLQKSAQVSGYNLTEEGLAKINPYSLKTLTADDVFAFKMTLCSNEVDRDLERFSIPALKKLASLFVGKTMLFDHRNAAAGQTARIFDAEVVTDSEVLTTTGEPYTKLIGYAYMPRTAKNADLIVNIESGITKELSVGCAVAGRHCSICGTDLRKEYCKHRKGQMYEGKSCHHVLSNPTDAYEVSFVAVPAQKDAGVTKDYDCDDTSASEARVNFIKNFIFCEKRKDDLIHEEETP